MTSEQVKDLLPEYALGALTDTEARALEAFLQDNPGCQAELLSWQAVVASLAFAVEPQDPPSHLRTRLLQAVRQFEDAGKNITIAPAQARTQTFSNNSSNVVQMPARAVPRPVAPPAPVVGRRWLALAAVLAVCALLTALVVVWRKNLSLQDENRALADRLQISNQTLLEEHTLHEALLGPDGRGITLQGTPVAPKANARLSYNVKSGAAVLAIRELPPAPSGKNYQIWFIAGGRPVPGPTFNTGAAGEAKISLQAPENGLLAEAFAVTLEPSYGVNAPTGEKYLDAHS
jgi:anti-sigma-K factor RskA